MGDNAGDLAAALLGEGVERRAGDDAAVAHQHPELADLGFEQLPGALDQHLV